MTLQRTKTIRYLIWTFAIAWLLQCVSAWLTLNGHVQAGQLMLTVVMYAPFAGVLLAGIGLKGMGWKPMLKANLKPLLAAWFLPGILTLLGALLYFGVFPDHFDLSGEYLRASVGDAVMQQMEAQGITYPVYIAIAVVSALLYAPLLNMFFALGEEVGWRGFLYPQLKMRFGRIGGLLLGGCIWGIWHWPLIWLIGYEYGTAYPGFPVSGMLLFCLFTVAAGIICDRLYEKSGCIWLPSIFHGAINAAATIPIAVCTTAHPSYTLLGPAPNGLLAGLPLMILAGIWLIKTRGTDA